LLTCCYIVVMKILYVSFFPMFVVPVCFPLLVNFAKHWISLYLRRNECLVQYTWKWFSVFEALTFSSALFILQGQMASLFFTRSKLKFALSVLLTEFVRCSVHCVLLVFWFVIIYRSWVTRLWWCLQCAAGHMLSYNEAKNTDVF
jgi:hypothetical protein